MTVPESVVPLKPPHLAELKSNNYMLNALTMMAAQDRGGTFGIGTGPGDSKPCMRMRAVEVGIGLLGA